MKDCDQLDFFAVLDGTADSRSLLHLEECAACREAFDSFRRLAGLLDEYFLAIEGGCSNGQELFELVRNDGTLSAEQTVHLKECSTCRRVYELLRDFATEEVEAEDVLLPPELADRVEVFRLEELKSRTGSAISQALGRSEDDATVVKLRDRALDNSEPWAAAAAPKDLLVPDEDNGSEDDDSIDK